MFNFEVLTRLLRGVNVGVQMKIILGFNFRKARHQMRKLTPLFIIVTILIVYGIVGTMEYTTCINGGICP